MASLRKKESSDRSNLLGYGFTLTPPGDDRTYLSPQHINAPANYPLTPPAERDENEHRSKRRKIDAEQDSLLISTPGYSADTFVSACPIKKFTSLEELAINYEPAFQFHTPLNASSSDWLCDITGISLDDCPSTQCADAWFDDAPAESQDDQVCFGMIQDISFTLSDHFQSRKQYGELTVSLERNGELRLEEERFLVGQLDDQTRKIIHGFMQEDSMDLQVSCVVKAQRSAAKRKPGLPTICPVGTLSVIIYGPLRMFDEVGEYMGTCGLFLQDPKKCDRNVRYRNPHRMSGLSEHAPWTLEQQMDEITILRETVQRSIDYLAEVDAKQNLPETSTPHCLKTELLSHQKKGLTFMLNREKGWNLLGQSPDIWKQINTSRDMTTYLNTITEESHCVAPPPFRGGILADHMGLGKTLSMIALVASDLDARSPGALIANPFSNDSLGFEPVRCTLIVLPPSLMDTWEYQLTTHSKPGALNWLRHYGNQRLFSRQQLGATQIVLTTYQTVVSEWKNSRRGSASSLLFSVTWHRIILDEAHYIRDRSTVSAQAIFALEAGRRWAVSGTPIQNHLSDLVTTLGFLRAHPYDDPKVFDVDISQLSKSGSETTAVKRLQNLINCISLRRSNSTIDLPPRHDQIHQLEFSKEERNKYEKARAETLEVMLGSLSSSLPHSGRCLNVLKQISTLRLICNLGLSAPDVNTTLAIQSSTPPLWNASKAREAFDTIVALGPCYCMKCKRDLSVPETQSTNIDDSIELYMSQCTQVICKRCYRRTDSTATEPTVSCSHTPKCLIAPVTTVESAAISGSAGLLSTLPKSTKIKALVTDLKRNGVDKSVVFSYWTSTLDSIELALREASIPFVRYDGKVSTNNRKIALNTFRTNPSVPIILFTISCGSVGLDLTVANRAYLMEPHWNPTVEEQALARIHRLGQKNEITTIRYIMKESYEEHIIRVQDKKKRLIDLLLPQKSQAPSDISRLKDLCKILT